MEELPVSGTAIGMRVCSLFVVLVVLVGCDRASPPLPPADHVYRTRGVVERLPSRNDDQMMILHEEIPGFVGVDGEVVPMRSMSMPFVVAEGVSTAGTEVGSKIAFTFEVRWAEGQPLLLTQLAHLPGTTELDLAD